MYKNVNRMEANAKVAGGQGVTHKKENKCSTKCPANFIHYTDMLYSGYVSDIGVQGSLPSQNPGRN